MKKVLVLLLDLIFAFIKPFLLIFMIYSIQKASIDSYNEFVRKADSPMFKEKSYDSLNITTGVLITISIIIILVMWIAIISMIKNDRIIPAGILSIIFLSVIAGILILTLFKKEVINDINEIKTTFKENVDNDNRCPYCEQVLSKTDLFCPYCGAKRGKE